VAVFGSLPEFPLIRTRKERSVFLGLVLENSFSFFGKLARTNGYGHLNFVNIPLLPGTAVHPDLAVLEPLIALAFFKGQEDGFQAYPMGAMRIGQVTGGIYLMRLHLAQQVNGQVDIGLGKRLLFNSSDFIKGHIQEVQPFFGDAAIASRCFGFAPADESFDVFNLIGIGFGRFFLTDKILNIGQPLIGFFSFQLKHAVIVGHKIHKPDDIFIKNGNISGCLIGYMYFMSVINQPDERAAHRDDIIIGMRTKDQRPFREGVGALRSVAVVSIRLAAGPARDGVLQLVKYPDANIVSRSALGEQVAHAVLIIIFISELKNRFFYFLAQPDHGAANKLIVPVDRGKQPGHLSAGKLFGCGLIQDGSDVVMVLQVGCRYLLVNFAFYGALDDRSLAFAP